MNFNVYQFFEAEAQNVRHPNTRTDPEKILAATGVFKKIIYELGSSCGVLKLVND